MDAELKGLGVDVDQLAEIRRQLKEVSDELNYIDLHRADFICWQNDTRDYFDHEQLKKDERKRVRNKIDDLRGKFQKRKQHYDERIKQYPSFLTSSIRSIINSAPLLATQLSSFLGSHNLFGKWAAVSP